MHYKLQEPQSLQNSLTLKVPSLKSARSLKNLAEQLLEFVDIRINGDRPWDIRVHDERLFRRIVAQGSLGLGESYMDGWWDCEQLDELVFRLVRAEHEGRFKVIPPFSLSLLFDVLRAKAFNLQQRSRAFMIAECHYDIGNDLYELMLDDRMIYTCAYWKDATSLSAAQEAKLDLVCRKLKLKPGMHVLDIGCGWGGFLKYAAEKYGARGTGITVSVEQLPLAQKMCAGFPIEIKLQDYRELDGQYDCIMSLGMFEHVGHKNYRTYMEVVNRCLKEDGFFVLQTIGSNKSTNAFDAWLDKYIFPNSTIPSVKQIGEAVEGLFVMEDWHNMSAYYDLTLMAWYKNFQHHWPKLRPKYGDRFYRMWTYYLLICAGLFRSRRQQLWQVVFSRHGLLNGYEAPR